MAAEYIWDLCSDEFEKPVSIDPTCPPSPGAASEASRGLYDRGRHIGGNVRRYTGRVTQSVKCGPLREGDSMMAAGGAFRTENTLASRQKIKIVI